MAENKKAVLLYCDIIHTMEELTDEEAGKVFKHYLRYINDLEPVAPDKLTQIAFEPIKQSLKRDLVKWEDTISARSESGRLGGIKSNASINEANEAVSVKVKDKVIVKDIINTEKLIFPFPSDEFLFNWNILIKEKKWKNKSFAALQASLDILKPHTEADAIQMIKNTISGQWQGLFEIKKNNNGGNNNNFTASPKLGTSAARVEALRNW